MRSKNNQVESFGNIKDFDDLWELNNATQLVCVFFRSFINFKSIDYNLMYELIRKIDIYIADTKNETESPTIYAIASCANTISIEKELTLNRAIDILLENKIIKYA